MGREVIFFDNLYNNLNFNLNGIELKVERRGGKRQLFCKSIFCKFR